jgi:hypothetical protein
MHKTWNNGKYPKCKLEIAMSRHTIVMPLCVALLGDREKRKRYTTIEHVFNGHHNTCNKNVGG